MRPLKIVMNVLLAMILAVVAIRPTFAQSGCIEIGTAQELNAMRNLPGDYCLISDIDLTAFGEWTPIGTQSEVYLGNFNGNGHAIRNLLVTGATGPAGLFGVLGGSVENLLIEGAVIETSGAYAGIVAGSTITGSILNVMVQGNVTGTDYVGGLAGAVENATVAHASSHGTITGENYIGGLIGSIVSSSVQDVHTSAFVSGPATSNYLSFNPADGTMDFVQIPHISPYSVGNFSVEAWFKWDLAGTDSVSFILSKGLEQFDVHTGGDSGVNGLRFIPVPRTTTVYQDGRAYQDIPSVLDSTWHHVATVWDFENQQVQLLVDGVQRDIYQLGVNKGKIASVPLLNPNVNPLANNTTPFYIGIRNQGGLAYPYTGQIADIRIWSRTRTPKEIKADMNRQLTGKESGLIGYWKLNEPSGNIAYDSSTFGNHGTVVNATRTTSNNYSGGIAAFSTNTINGYYNTELSNQPENELGTVVTAAELKQAGVVDTIGGGWDLDAGYTYPTMFSHPVSVAITEVEKATTLVGEAYKVYFSAQNHYLGQVRGDVTISDGSASCTASLATGFCSLTSTSAGDKDISIEYAGNAVFSSADGESVAHTVEKKTITISTLTDTNDPSVTGQGYTVSATLSDTSATGSITFTDGTDSCDGTISSGNASCILSSSSIGSKTITASYDGDDTFDNANKTTSHTVYKSLTTLTINSDTPDPSEVNNKTTVNVTVAAQSPGGGYPTGTVYMDDQTKSCQATLINGSASCEITSITIGNKTITATYGGDANYLPSYNTTPHTVNKAASKITITSHSPSPSTVGTQYTINFKVEPASGTATDVTGNVTISDGTNQTNKTLSNQTSNIVASASTAGQTTWTINYLGNSTYAASSTTLVHEATKANTSVTVSPVCVGGCKAGIPYQVSYLVYATTGSGIPSGTVSITDGAASCQATLNANGSGSCYLTSTTGGEKTLTADYGGDGGFNTSSNTTSVTVYKTTPTINFTGNTPNPSVPGQPYKISVSAGGNAGELANAITITDGEDSCEAVITSGTGNCDLVSTTAGSKTITASYAGDDLYNSTNTSTTHSVNKGNSTVTITERNPATTIPGQAYQVAVKVEKDFETGTDLTGTVTISNEEESCTTILENAAGSCELTDTVVGTPSISAQYNGDDNYNTSIDYDTHNVEPANSTTTLRSDINPSATGETVTLSVEVILGSPSEDIATGSVMVKNGATKICQITLTNGKGDCEVSDLAVGDHTLVAVYSPGDSSATSSESDPFTLNIQNITLSDHQTSTAHSQVGVLSTENGNEPSIYSLASKGRICNAQNSANNSLFSIHDNSLNLNPQSAAGQYNVCVSSEGADGGVVQKAFEITINDIPTLDDNSLDNQTGTPSHSEIGTFTLSGGRDPQTFGFATYGDICTENNSVHNTKFSIDELELSRLDSTVAGTYFICVQVEDAEGDQAQHAYTITVKQAPTEINLSHSGVSSNGNVVGIFSATDGEPPYSYTFANDGETCDATHQTGNMAFSIDGTTLKRANGTGVGEYSICVQVEDANSGHTQASFTISVNEAIADLSLDNTNVQNTEIIVGNFVVTGGAEPFNYSLESSGNICDSSHLEANSHFDLAEGSTTLKLEPQTAAGQYTICAQVQDANGDTTQAAITITVLGQNGGTISQSLSSEKLIDGDPSGTVVGTFLSNAPGAIFAITNTDLLPDGNLFQINEQNELVSLQPANRASKDNYILRVLVSDPNMGSLSVDHQISVLGSAVAAGGAAYPDSGNTTRGQQIRLDVLANDSLSPGATRWSTFDIVEYPQHGKASIGSIIYTPEAGFVGEDVVSYRACDDLNLCIVGRVNFTVRDVNSQPELTGLEGKGKLPATGFAPGIDNQSLPMPTYSPYKELGQVRLSIPTVGIDAEVVGVTAGSESWNVNWLGAKVGWLAGSAFPGWVGNSVLTGHNVDSSGKPGVFAKLSQLKYGDSFSITAYGETHTYIVRENKPILPEAISTAFVHKEKTSWITLLTCEGYNPVTNSYSLRRLVRAELVSIK